MNALILPPDKTYQSLVLKRIDSNKHEAAKEIYHFLFELDLIKINKVMILMGGTAVFVVLILIAGNLLENIGSGFYDPQLVRVVGLFGSPLLGYISWKLSEKHHYCQKHEQTVEEFRSFTSTEPGCSVLEELLTLDPLLELAINLYCPMLTNHPKEEG